MELKGKTHLAHKSHLSRTDLNVHFGVHSGLRNDDAICPQIWNNFPVNGGRRCYFWETVGTQSARMSR